MNIYTQNYQAYHAPETSREVYRNAPSVRPARKNAAVDAEKDSAAQVSISSEANTVAQVRKKIDSLPDERWSIVKKIKKRIEHNDYPLENNMYRALKKMADDSILDPFLNTHN